MDEDTLVKEWSDMYQNEVTEYSAPKEVSNEAVFAEVYHSLAHSPMAETMVQLEQSHATALKNLDRPNEVEGSQLEEARRESDASHVRETQRREFRQWVMTVHEDDGGVSGSRSLSHSLSDSAFSMSTHSVRAESFTITLGAQMKQMHNLRLVSGDALFDLCKYPEDSSVALPQRLQTAMALYSSNLSGIVLLANEANFVNKDFCKVANNESEFHFQTYDQQVDSVQNEHLEGALAWRKSYLDNSTVSEEEKLELDVSTLKSGDFYVTKHSNLCDVHVVFHMICDESVDSGSINSRHPVVMGLRNVLKIAAMSAVTTLTIPLFLALNMGEQMTVAWCMKRAELVFKCVKGFMMEVASWGGSELRTLQFLVPKDVDQDVFNRLAAMLPTIFRTANPIRAS